MQALLLVLYSGITPDRVRGTILNARDKTWVSGVKGKHFPCCAISPGLLYLFSMPLHHSHIHISMWKKSTTLPLQILNVDFLSAVGRLGFASHHHWDFWGSFLQNCYFRTYFTHIVGSSFIGLFGWFVMEVAWNRRGKIKDPQIGPNNLMEPFLFLFTPSSVQGLLLALGSRIT